MSECRLYIECEKTLKPLFFKAECDPCLNYLKAFTDSEKTIVEWMSFCKHCNNLLTSKNLFPLR